MAKRAEVGAQGRERERGAEPRCGEGDRLRDPVPDAICGAAAPAARLTCGCSSHGNGRRPGGARVQFPRRRFSCPGAQPPAGLPRLRRRLGPCRRHRFVLPLPPVPEPLGPGACQRQQLVLGIRRRGHGWRSPRRDDGGLAGPRCGAWAAGRSLLLPPPGLGAWGGYGVSAAAAAATPAELLAAALPASAPPPPPPLPPGPAAAAACAPPPTPAAAAAAAPLLPSLLLRR